MATQWLHEVFPQMLGKQKGHVSPVFIGSSTWARTRDLRINRKPGYLKTLVNQRLIRVFDKRVIFRVITPKVT